MELRVLRYFLIVVQEGSITKAAEVLHVTQPISVPFTSAIRQLLLNFIRPLRII